jgi:homogentisate 1,2-dioxygenase
MIDTFRPLHLGPGAMATEDESYPWSWAQGLDEEPRR